MHAHLYHVCLSQKLWDHKQDLVARVRGRKTDDPR